MTQQFCFWINIQKNWKQGLKKILYIHAHSSITYNSGNVVATKVPIDGWMDKQNLAYLYNGIFSALKRK